MFVLLSAASAYLFFGSRGKNASDTLQSTYKIGSTISQLNIDKRQIVIDFYYTEGSGAPLVLGVYGYSLPSRPLKQGERLIIVEESADLVALLYFCPDNRLCFTELRGS